MEYGVHVALVMFELFGLGIYFLKLYLPKEALFRALNEAFHM